MPDGEVATCIYLIYAEVPPAQLQNALWVVVSISTLTTLHVMHEHP